MTRRFRLTCMLALLLPVCGATARCCSWRSANGQERRRLAASRRRTAPKPPDGGAPVTSSAFCGAAKTLARNMPCGPRLFRPRCDGRRPSRLACGRQLELVQLLDRVAAFDEDERASLACLAADLQIDDVVEYLGAGWHRVLRAGEGPRARARAKPFIVTPLAGLNAEEDRWHAARWRCWSSSPGC